LRLAVAIWLAVMSDADALVPTSGELTLVEAVDQVVV
jgi:hypothetical protein